MAPFDRLSKSYLENFEQYIIVKKEWSKERRTSDVCKYNYMKAVK